KIISDLKDKFVLIAGPRQVGKTTMARRIIDHTSPNHRNAYFNWDYQPHRKIIRDMDWPRNSPVIVLDEIHKYSKWKTLLKGFFDTEGHQQKIIVTGSARLDVYKKGGESLMGRAYHFKLHPLTVGELSRNGDSPKTENLMDPNLWIETNSNMCMDIFKQLFVIGGFPEPFLKGDEQEAKRWRINRKDQVLKEDIRDLTQIHNIDKAEHLLDLLVERVGSLISVNSLREDLEVDNKTVSSWIDIFEKLHIIFSIVPYSTKLQRSIKKARKIYFWDWAEVPDPGARFENLVAVHLLKYCDYMKNVAGENLNLRYVRDRNKREVDFLITKNNNPWILLETKYGQTRESANLSYFANKLNIEHRYQITTKKHHSRHVVPCWQILSGLP
ncbi:MAG: ATP-binding protein, partial [Desulfobacula sp.]|nr:ATP-binding protein [Desulfobacula sp.]